MLDSYFNLALVYDNLNRYDEAITFYKKAIDLDKGMEEAYYNLGLIYYDLERYKDAIFQFNQVVFWDPAKSATYSDLADCYWELKEKKKACSYLKEAIERGYEGDMNKALREYCK